MTLLLKNDEIRSLLGMEETIPLLEAGYKRFAAGAIVNVPWSMTTVPIDKPEHEHRLVELRATWPELGISAMRIVSVVTDCSNGAARNIAPPAGRRVDQVLLFDIYTGALLAILAGQYLQLLRVAAQTALGVKYLAREGEQTLGIIGSGGQAETQLQAIALVRPLKRVLVYSRSAENRARFAETARDRYAFPVEAVASSDLLVDQSDLITAAASATAPVFDGARVRPGTHVNTLTAPMVDDTVLRRASLFTTTKSHVHLYAFQQPPRYHREEHPYYRHWDRVQELERVMTGEQPGRQSPEEITLFFGDGAGLQFAAMGHVVLQRARERGVGMEAPADWLPGTAE